MTENKQRKSEAADSPSISEEANEWYQQFCNCVDATFVDNAQELPSTSGIGDYQNAALLAVLRSLVDSGMSPESIEECCNKYTSSSSDKGRVRQFGLGKGKLVVISDDDDHLEHFTDYVP